MTNTLSTNNHSGGQTPIPGSLAHYKAFCDLVKTKNPEQHLYALVAFGLYMEAECRWAESQPNTPTESECIIYHSNGSLPHVLRECEEKAQSLMKQFGEILVASHRKGVLYDAVKGAVNAVHETKKSFLRGVAEAFVGAFLWTIFLIIVSLIAKWAGIDLIEVFSRVSGKGS